jgi:hypothetical protein
MRRSVLLHVAGLTAWEAGGTARAQSQPCRSDVCPQVISADGRVTAHGGIGQGTYAGMVPDAAATALGASSCGTTACHGGPQAGNRDVLSFAFTIWAKDDPHAGAYETLHQPRSQRMANLLGIGPAHRAAVCLACHSMQAEARQPLPREVLADGVACGSCHGDATLWRDAHTLPSWKTLSVEERGALGYRDLADVSARVRNCVPCHVGDESREVDHDLIAAGHPRLAFEFSAYQRLWARHWSPSRTVESRADFGARAWAVGQAETARAVAALLAVRAERTARAAEERRSAPGDPAADWPEFAEFDCYACHRSLGPRSFVGGRAEEWRNPVPGSPAWQPWQTSGAWLTSGGTDGMAPDFAAVERAIDTLKSVLAARWDAADPQRMATLATEARALEAAAATAAAALESRDRIELSVSPERIDGLVTARPPEWRTWDSAVQRVLALEAALAAGPAPLGTWPTGTLSTVPSETREALDALRDGLRFPAGRDGPLGFDPVRFRDLGREVPWPAVVRPAD